MGNYREEAARGWVALRAEHPHEALRWLAGGSRDGLEAHCRIDVVAKNEFPRVRLSRQEKLDCVGQEGRTKCRIAIGASFQRLLEAAGDWQEPSQFIQVEGVVSRLLQIEG